MTKAGGLVARAAWSALARGVVLLLGAAVILGAGAARADAPPAVLSLEDAGPAAGGGHWALLRIALQPGWKTYWRISGEVGMPTRLDWRGSENVAALSPLWPRPRVLHDFGMRNFGYDRSVALPLALSPVRPEAPMTMRLQVSLAACREVCVPISAVLTATLPSAEGGRGDVPEAPADALAAAKARAPITGDRAARAVLRCSAVAEGGGMMRLSVGFAGSALAEAEAAVVERAPGALIGTATPRRGADGAWAIDLATARAAAPIVTIFGPDAAVQAQVCGVAAPAE